MNKKFDATKPVQTRDGRAARIICTDREGGRSDGLIVALVDTGSQERAFYYDQDGHGTCHESLDLVNVPVPCDVTFWLNIYPKGWMSNRAPIGSFENSRLEADESAAPGRVACVQVTVKANEGDGL
jgi:YD repeat-containing protein